MTRRKLIILVSARLEVQKNCGLPVIYFRSPLSIATRTNDEFKELLDIGCPVSYPFDLSADGKNTTCSFPLECANFVGAYAFGKPNSSGCRNIFAEAVVQ